MKRRDDSTSDAAIGGRSDSWSPSSQCGSSVSLTILAVLKSSFSWRGERLDQSVLEVSQARKSQAQPGELGYLESHYVNKHLAKSTVVESLKKRSRHEQEAAGSDEEGASEASKRTKGVSNPRLMPTSDVLTLDIRGEKSVKTLRSTLTFVAGSKLADMFSGRWDDALPKNEKGQFLIDRKPELFLPLLDVWKAWLP